MTNINAVAAVVFYFTKARFLPRIQPDKFLRWDYDYLEFGDAPSGRYEYGLADIEFRRGSSDDEWTVGSSSAFSPSGSMSPIDESQSLWEGETLASHSDSDNVETTFERF